MIVQHQAIYIAMRARYPHIKAPLILRYARLAEKLHRLGMIKYGDPFSIRLTETKDLFLQWSTTKPSSHLFGAWLEGGTRRWCEDTAKSGLRWLGWADELHGRIDHKGWYCDEDGDKILRGAVWLLPSRHGRVQYVAGYHDPYNENAALIDFDVIEGCKNCTELRQCLDIDAHREAARRADDMAKEAAEEEREYNEQQHACINAAQKLDVIGDELDGLTTWHLPDEFDSRTIELREQIGRLVYDLENF